MWGKRTPERRPSAFVPASTVDDVVSAVRSAHSDDRPITVRAGGHNWSGSHLRDDAVVVDVSAMDEVIVDEDAMTAVVGPGVEGSVLAEGLERKGLFFPAGHCRGVKLGGYLLQGGFGWNSRALGPACMSVNAVDVVLADGSRVHADANENSDLYWAARGSGTGFFGVDNDQYGHMNNATYFEYIDTAVNGWLMQETGVDIRDLPAIGIVASTGCDYFAELGFPDTIEIGLATSRIGTSSITYRLGIFRAGDPALRALAHFVHVYVDAETRRPVPIPDVVRAAVETLPRVDS